MVTVLIILAMTLAFFAGVFCCLKSVQLGLRWQIQIANKQEPKMEIKNPVTEVMQTMQETKQTIDFNQVMKEWINGPEEEKR